jgi:hypothetical protein
MKGVFCSLCEKEAVYRVKGVLFCEDCLDPYLKENIRIIEREITAKKDNFFIEN